MFKDICCVLIDIEGTTTAIDFVHKTLFPYSIDNMDEFFENYKNKDEIEIWLEELSAEIEKEVDIVCAKEILKTWINEDRKHGLLKKIQGKIWQKGYDDGILKSHVYVDVLPQLLKWKESNLSLGIYSSGSVAAQKLLFSHTVEGNLLDHFSYFFDTKVGGKKEALSYARIAEEIGVSPVKILFLSDVVAELDAAKASGLNTCQLKRKVELLTGDHLVVQSFDDIEIS